MAQYCRVWSELKINSLVCDETCALIPNHVGRVIKIISDTEPEQNFILLIKFYSGRVAICNRSDLGFVNINEFNYPEPDDKKFWCHKCEKETTPLIFYYNIFGLVRGICTKCNSYGAIEYFYRPFMGK